MVFGRAWIGDRGWASNWLTNWSLTANFIIADVNTSWRIFAYNCILASYFFLTFSMRLASSGLIASSGTICDCVPL